MKTTWKLTQEEVNLIAKALAEKCSNMTMDDQKYESYETLMKLFRRFNTAAKTD